MKLQYEPFLKPNFILILMSFSDFFLTNQCYSDHQTTSSYFFCHSSLFWFPIKKLWVFLVYSSLIKFITFPEFAWKIVLEKLYLNVFSMFSEDFLWFSTKLILNINLFDAKISLLFRLYDCIFIFKLHKKLQR